MKKKVSAEKINKMWTKKLVFNISIQFFLELSLFSNKRFLKLNIALKVIFFQLRTLIYHEVIICIVFLCNWLPPNILFYFFLKKVKTMFYFKHFSWENEHGFTKTYYMLVILMVIQIVSGKNVWYDKSSLEKIYVYPTSWLNFTSSMYTRA